MAHHVTLPMISNRDKLEVTLELVDDDTEDAIDLSTLTAMTFTLWDPDCPTRTVLSAEIDDGITVDDAAAGLVTIAFTADEISAALCAKSYSFRLAATIDGEEGDLTLGTLPVEQGGPA